MSKAKSDKNSPDLDTPTDLPPAAVNAVQEALAEANREPFTG